MSKDLEVGYSPYCHHVVLFFPRNGARESSLISPDSWGARHLLRNASDPLSPPTIFDIVPSESNGISFVLRRKLLCLPVVSSKTSLTLDLSLPQSHSNFSDTVPLSADCWWLSVFRPLYYFFPLRGCFPNLKFSFPRQELVSKKTYPFFSHNLSAISR